MGGAIAVGATVAIGTSVAEASRSYGAFSPFDHLITLRTSDSGSRLQAAAMRVQLRCPGDLVQDYAARFTIVSDRPPAATRDRGFLIRRQAGRRLLRYEIWGTLGGATEYQTYTGELSLTEITSRRARVRLSLRSTSTSEAGTCRLARTLRARREPGRLFVGFTDDNEPVWVRKQGNSVEWLSGFGTGCQPQGFMEGIHGNALPLDGPNRFGWERLLPGFMHYDYDQQIQISGRLVGNRASGSLRIVGSGGPDNAERCDTGLRRWRATAT